MEVCDSYLVFKGVYVDGSDSSQDLEIPRTLEGYQKIAGSDLVCSIWAHIAQGVPTVQVLEPEDYKILNGIIFDSIADESFCNEQNVEEFIVEEAFAQYTERPGYSKEKTNPELRAYVEHVVNGMKKLFNF